MNIKIMLLVLVATAVSVKASTISYTYQFLGCGHNPSLNDNGHVVWDGGSGVGGLIYRNGFVANLGNFSPTGISNEDVVVGIAPDTGVYWQNLSVSSATMDVPNDVEGGLIVGRTSSATYTGQGAYLNISAFGGELPRLTEDYPWYNAYSAVDINSNGMIVGWAMGGTSGHLHPKKAIAWTDNMTVPIDLGAGDNSFSCGLNDAGQVVGSGVGRDAWFLWHDNSIAWHPVQPDGFRTVIDIGGEGQVIGEHGGNRTSHVWIDGEYILLNQFTSNLSSELLVTDINENGQIVGVAGNNKIVLLTQVPEPSILYLSPMFLLSFFFRRRLSK